MFKGAYFEQDYHSRKGEKNRGIVGRFRGIFSFLADVEVKITQVLINVLWYLKKCKCV